MSAEVTEITDVNDPNYVAPEDQGGGAGEVEIDPVTGQPIVEQGAGGEEENFDFTFDEQADFKGYEMDKIEGFDAENVQQQELLEDLAEEGERLGLNQEQMESFVKMRMASLTTDDPTPATPQEVKEALNKGLSRAEKRAYPATKQFIFDGLEGTELEDVSQEIANNPQLVKVFHLMREKLMGSSTQPKVNSKVVEPSSKKGSFNIPSDKAFEIYNNFLTENAGSENFAEQKAQFFKGMFERATNKKELEVLMKDYI